MTLVNGRALTGAGVCLELAVLPPGTRTAPAVPNEVITTTPAIPAGATTMTASAALTGYMFVGTILTFNDGTTDFPVYVTSTHNVGDTALDIANSTVEVPATSTATARYRFFVPGVVTIDQNTSTSVEEFLYNCVIDPTTYTSSDVSVFTEAQITTQSSTIPVTMKLREFDQAYTILQEVNNTAGQEVFFWLSDPAPPNFNTGFTISGAAQVQNFSATKGAEATIDVTFDLRPQGKFILAYPSGA